MHVLFVCRLFADMDDYRKMDDDEMMERYGMMRGRDGRDGRDGRSGENGMGKSVVKIIIVIFT